MGFTVASLRLDVIPLIGRVAIERPNGKSSFCNWTYFGLIREVLSVELERLQCVA